mmetsp:Transcript_124139/g.276974  ORF Transcript_124139/g.276974 Transcript_124139/m.276974 type:complete len:302 (-) Transcript_124139:342-1247(-)
MALALEPADLALLKERIALRREGALEEIPRVVVAQDRDGLADSRDLPSADLAPLLPLGLLLIQGLGDIGDEVCVSLDLGLQLIELRRGFLPREALGAVLLLLLNQGLLGCIPLSALGDHEFVEKVLGLLLLLSRLHQVRGKGLKQLAKHLLDLEGACLVALLEGCLAIELLPIPCRHLASKKTAKEERIALAEELVAQGQRLGKSGRLSGARLGTIATAHCEEHTLLVALGGRSQDVDGAGERIDGLIHLVCGHLVVLLLLPPDLGCDLDAAPELFDLLLEVNTLCGELDAAGIQVRNVGF